VADEPVNLGSQDYLERSVGFQLTLQVLRPPPSLRLRFEAFRKATLYLNGESLATASDTGSVLTRGDIDLAPRLKAGANQLLIVARNDRGPPALRVTSDLPDAGSSERWLASADGSTWRSARRASSHRNGSVAAEFPSPWQSLLKTWPVALASAVFGVLVLWAVPPLFRARPPDETVAVVRWLLVTGLGILYAYNFGRVRNDVGMDLDSHFEYLEYVLARGALPLANEGWQMFQPPLAYLVAAALTFVTRGLGFAIAQADLTRGLTMGVSLLTVWLSCRTAERIFPGRPDLTIVAMVVGASLPAGIYMAHAFGNEPYFACLGAWLLYLLAGPQPGWPPLWRGAMLGIVGGLALLAKTSALILVVAAAPLLWQQVRTDQGARSAARCVAIYLALLAAVAGWWYLRNLIELGRPFVGGWEGGRGIDWWQHPGFRTPGHLLAFGRVLFEPIFAGAIGFWDGMYGSLWGDSYLSSAIVRTYAPNWNYDFMLALYLLALPLTLAVAAGTARALASGAASDQANQLRLAAALLILYLGAAFHLYAGIPIYSAAKGSYLLVLAPCLGALAAWGAEPLLRRRFGQALVAIVLGAWLSHAALAFLAHTPP
jgi:hypothetical protein